MNVADPPQSPSHMKHWGGWPCLSLVATVRKLLELLPQSMDDCQGYVCHTPCARLLPGVIGVPSAEDCKKSFLRNGYGIFIQMDQTSTHPLYGPHPRAQLFFETHPRTFSPPSSIPESLASLSTQTSEGALVRSHWKTIEATFPSPSV